MSFTKSELTCILGDYADAFNEAVYPNEDENHIDVDSMIKVLLNNREHGNMGYMNICGYCLGAYENSVTRTLVELKYDGFLKLLEKHFGDW